MNPQFKKLQEQRVPTMWSGFEHPEGWDDLILDLDEQIAEIDPNYQVHQCKEKFAGLRYYVGFSEGLSEQDRDDINRLIRTAELLSQSKCMTCGSEGTQQQTKSGYYVVACDEHSETT